jgi:hypothetical protein
MPVTVMTSYAIWHKVLLEQATSTIKLTLLTPVQEMTPLKHRLATIQWMAGLALITLMRRQSVFNKS